MLIGEILLEQTRLTQELLDTALAIQAERSGRIGEILVMQKSITEDELAKALATQLDLPFIQELPKEIDIHLVERIPINYVKRFHFIPFKNENGVVDIATSEPLELFALDDLRLTMNADIRISVTSYGRILNAINHVYMEASERDLEKDKLNQDGEEEDDITDLITATDDDAPIIRFVNNLLLRATREGASDIHIEPMEKDMVVRLRIDGVLYEVTRPPKAAQAAITSRVKIMGNLNIAEKRLPQDGRIRIKIAGKDIDIRLNTLPVAHGERLVMRLLDRSATLLQITDLGFLEQEYRKFLKLIQQPHGIILVTGPTGSGKTTTLYTALSKLNSPDRNIITIEDPVEYQLPGIGQIPVNQKIDMTFAAGLRAILRQDPDIIMIGEIRDIETAEIAVQASLTGHLVLSTVHTNDSTSTITRMVDMGVEPFLVASSIIGILAQRLIRLLCNECKEAYRPTDEELLNLGLRRENLPADQVFYRAVGCPACMGKGYRGRKGIYELAMIDEELQAMILQGKDAPEIKRRAMAKGMFTLRMDGAEKVKRGWTSVDEVIRVTQDQIIADM